VQARGPKWIARGLGLQSDCEDLGAGVRQALSTANSAKVRDQGQQRGAAGGVERAGVP
jgi:hypothetical protein